MAISKPVGQQVEPTTDEENRYRAYEEKVEDALEDGWKVRDQVSGASLVYDHDEHEKRLIFVDEGQVSDVEVSWSLTSVSDAFEWLKPDELSYSAARQGDIYFDRVFADKHTDIVPMLEAAAEDGSMYRLQIHEGESEYRYTVEYSAGENIGSTNHQAEEVAVLRKTGAVAFVAQNVVKRHNFEANPRVFVRGAVIHEEHTTYYADEWVEVVPNKVSGLGVPSANLVRRPID